MAIERARTQIVEKPWGSTDLRPWRDIHGDGAAIGEIWFHRADDAPPEPALLLKLLFTKEPLSIQVHPDDAYAHSIGLPNGKTEAWYILSATPDAKVAVGLKREISKEELRTSIQDGTIADLMQWRPVSAGDIIFVPAGTIHAIGPDLVLAEIQQRSDATFRLFDYGRKRETHADQAVAVARCGPADAPTTPTKLTDARTVLVANPYFVLERIDLPPGTTWALLAQQETWVLFLDGGARIDGLDASRGEAIFVNAQPAARIDVGPHGFTMLAAYAAAKPCPQLLTGLAAGGGP